MRVLLAEDSERLRELLGGVIRRAGYGLDIAVSVAELLANCDLVSYDLIVVDLGLPDGDGLDAIRTMRTRGSTVPILIITARDHVDDRIAGLDTGADDYLTKPFNHGEFLARVRALLRRPSMLAGPVLKSGDIELDERTGGVRTGANIIDIRGSERRLLALLMRRADTIVAKVAIEQGLSELGRPMSSNAIETLVSRLRKSIASSGSKVRVETIHGVGYVLRTQGD